MYVRPFANLFAFLYACFWVATCWAGPPPISPENNRRYGLTPDLVQKFQLALQTRLASMNPPLYSGVDITTNFAVMTLSLHGRAGQPDLVCYAALPQALSDKDRAGSLEIGGLAFVEGDKLPDALKRVLQGITTKSTAVLAQRTSSPAVPSSETTWTPPERARLLIYLVALLPWVLAVFSGLRFLLKPPHPAWKPYEFAILAMYGFLTCYLAISQAQGGWPINNSAQRDWAAALQIVAGQVPDVTGPSIFSTELALGPLFSLTLAPLAWFSPFPYGFIALSLAALLLTFLIGYLFLRRAGGRIAGGLWAFLFLAPFLLITNLTNLTHDFLGLPFVALFAYLLWDFRRTHEDGRLPLAALCAGLAMQYYMVFAPLLLSLAYVMLAERRSVVWRHTLPRVVAAIVLTQAFTLFSVVLWWMHAPASPLFATELASQRLPWEAFWDSLWGVLSCSPLQMTAPVVAGVVLVGYMAITRKRRPFDPAPSVLLSLILPPLCLLILGYPLFRDRYAVVLFPGIFLTAALGWGFLLGPLGGRMARRPWLIAAGIGLVLAGTLRMDFPAGVRMESGTTWQEQRALAEARLADAGAASPRAIEEATHGLGVMDRGWTAILPLYLASRADSARRGAACFGEATAFWLGPKPRFDLDPDALRHDLTLAGTAFSLVTYATQIDTKRLSVTYHPTARVMRGLLAQERKLPYRMSLPARSVMAWVGALIRKDDQPFIWNRDDALAPSVIHVELFARPGGFTRPVVVQTNPTCRVRAFAGDLELHAVRTEPGPNVPAAPPLQAGLFIPPPHARGLRFDIDTHAADLSYLDIYDLPVRLSR